MTLKIKNLEKKPHSQESQDQTLDQDQKLSHQGGRRNASYYITIYGGGDVNILYDGDGIDSNGNIFIYGVDIKGFSQGNRINEPIDYDGYFILING